MWSLNARHSYNTPVCVNICEYLIRTRSGKNKDTCTLIHLRGAKKKNWSEWHVACEWVGTKKRKEFHILFNYHALLYLPQCRLFKNLRFRNDRRVVHASIVLPDRI